MLRADELKGKTIGKYDIYELVGDGGQAIVYKAWHRDLHAWVALKILKDDLAKKEPLRERFRKEARLQFRLHHPHIVRVIEIIEEERLLGIVMDWVQGNDLDHYIENAERPFSLVEVDRLFLPLLSAVGYAHQHKVIHRDLKPSNVLLMGKAGEERPLVMDFGIAKSLEEGESTTKTGGLLGTPSYIAPEQISSSKHVDHRADIYSLGITLYQMLSLRLPFMGGDLLQMITMHLMESPPPFSAWNVEVAPEIEAIVMRSLAKDPKARFATCEDFADALRNAIYQQMGIPVVVSSSSPSLASLPAVPLPPSSQALLPNVRPSLPPESQQTTVDNEEQTNRVIHTLQQPSGSSPALQEPSGSSPALPLPSGFAHALQQPSGSSPALPLPSGSSPLLQHQSYPPSQPPPIQGKQRHLLLILSLIAGLLAALLLLDALQPNLLRRAKQRISQAPPLSRGLEKASQDPPQPIASKTPLLPQDPDQKTPNSGSLPSKRTPPLDPTKEGGDATKEDGDATKDTKAPTQRESAQKAPLARRSTPSPPKRRSTASSACLACLQKSAWNVEKYEARAACEQVTAMIRDCRSRCSSFSSFCVSLGRVKQYQTKRLYKKSSLCRRILEKKSDYIARRYFANRKEEMTPASCLKAFSD